jgi:hypothetical protein
MLTDSTVDTRISSTPNREQACQGRSPAGRSARPVVPRHFAKTICVAKS